MQSESDNRSQRLCITQFQRFLSDHRVGVITVGDTVYSSWYIMVNPNVIRLYGNSGSDTIRMVQAVRVFPEIMEADILYLSLETAKQKTIHLTMSAA